MNDRFIFLKPYAATARAWLVNMSVASFAVGLFQWSLKGWTLGLVTLVCAFLLDYVTKED